MEYNWQQKDWKKFKYDESLLESKLFLITEKIGQLKGIMNVIPTNPIGQSTIEVLVNEAIKTSEIEGEFFSREDVMSSVKRNLGFETKRLPRNLEAKGIAKLISHLYKNYGQAFSKQTLFKWHKMIFPKPNNMVVGEWRKHKEPMQIVSGRVGKEIIHFEAPPSKAVEKEMELFINWYNDEVKANKNSIPKAVLTAAVAHLYFESIHPFQDGNGRIGRAISEKAILQIANFPLLISLSSSIAKDKKAYYSALQKGQSSNVIDDWVNYFLTLVIDALDQSKATIDFVLKKTQLFDRHANKLNKRQLKVLHKMLKSPEEKFENGISAKKYMVIAKTTKATATRDLQKLVELDIIISKGKGRSVTYEVVM